MFPDEIINTRFWIQHALPMSSPLPPRLTDDIRVEIRAAHGPIDDASLDTLVRRERARLDLQWCLNKYFRINVSNPTVGQLVMVNIFGSMRFAYITNVSGIYITISPVERFGYFVVVCCDDIYTAHHTPSYNHFVAWNPVFHRQHVRDYLTNERELPSSEFIQTNSPPSCVQPFATDAVDHTWPEGTESWHFHDTKPQRDLFATPESVSLVIASAPSLSPQNLLDATAKPTPIRGGVQQSVSLTLAATHAPEETHSSSLMTLPISAPFNTQYYLKSLHRTHVHSDSVTSRPFSFVPFDHRLRQRLFSHASCFLTLILTVFVRIWDPLVCARHYNYGLVRCKSRTQSSASFSVVPLHQYVDNNYFFVRSIETLRHLESLLIYGIT